MNLNVKLEVDEEQALQYVNRFAINIPSGAAAFNLNIVNPGLNNQSYILNPVSSVGQNIVTYQPSMAVQSYIAVPAETDGNLIHSLPVGVPVPVRLPVSTGVISNHNFINPGFIIGSEDCNSSGSLQLPNNNKTEDELKINDLDKPMKESIKSNANPLEIQAIGLNYSQDFSSKVVIKKPCPLEMSIKAANIDMEFEKCESEIPVLTEDKLAQINNQQIIIQNTALKDEIKIKNFKVPSPVSPLQPPNDADGKSKRSKTEITWENNKISDSVTINDFQESLICEVEEVNDDEEDEDENENENENENEEEKEKENESKEVFQVDIRNKEVHNCNENNFVAPFQRKNKECDSEASSGASRQKKICGNKSNKISSSLRKKACEEEKGKKAKFLKKENERNADCDFEWSDSDDDTLNLKRIKNEFDYKCFYEPSTAKSAISHTLKDNVELKKFVRVRSCCSKKECGKKISVKDQKVAYKNFCDLESNAKKDAYLLNCIEQIRKNKNLEKENIKAGIDSEKTVKKQLLVNDNIQLEIENESNGNQKLSDEIQNAIKESLKDCIANESKEMNRSSREEEAQEGNVESNEKGEKNTWNFYIVVERCRKKVCLQFLLKLFRITKNRIKQLQKKILSGSPLVEDSSTKTNQKLSAVWEMAKSHLDALVGEKCMECNVNYEHRFLPESCSKEDLFVNFKKYYRDRTGSEPTVKYSSYKRFLDKEKILNSTAKKKGLCVNCEEMKKRQKGKTKVAKTSAKKKESNSKAEKEKRASGKSEVQNLSSDDEPLIKNKRLKLSLPLKSEIKKNQEVVGKRNYKSSSLDNKGRVKSCREKSKRPASKGRDVWSLMLLHLETMPYKECHCCLSKKKHRFLDPSLTTQALFEDYRKYFLKETNSELGLGFTMYEKYFTRNCNYTILDLDPHAIVCPRCAVEK